MIVPLLEPEVKATETFRFVLDCACVATCPVTLNWVCAEITGKQEGDGLLTDVTVPVSVFPFWVKLTASLVAAVL